MLVAGPATGVLRLHFRGVGPSAAFFDLGVFAVVVGSTLLLLTAIAHQSLRSLRLKDAGGPEDA